MKKKKKKKSISARKSHGSCFYDTLTNSAHRCFFVAIKIKYRIRPNTAQYAYFFKWTKSLDVKVSFFLVMIPRLLVVAPSLRRKTVS